MLIFLAD